MNLAWLIRKLAGGAIPASVVNQMLRNSNMEALKVWQTTFSHDDFSEEANTTPASIEISDLTGFPNDAQIIDLKLTCTEAVAQGATPRSMNFKIGTTDGGEQWVADATCDDADETLVAIGSVHNEDLFVEATPGANWDVLDAGSWRLSVVYIDFSEL